MLADRLLRLAAHFPAVVVTGARQAGKTTLMRATFRDHHYVSLDLPTTADQAERNPDLFLHHHPGAGAHRRGAVRARPVPPPEGGHR